MYSVTVVGNNAVSSAEEVMCLDEWLLGGGTDGIEVNIGGSTSKLVSQDAGPGTGSPGTGSPGTGSPGTGTSTSGTGTSGTGPGVQPSNITSTISGVSGWVWAVIAIVLVGILLAALLLILVVLVVRRKDKKPSDNFREHMLDDMDDAHSAHSVGVVENPLYAEHENYTYDELAKNEENDVNIGEVKTEDLSAALEPTKEDDF